MVAKRKPAAKKKAPAKKKPAASGSSAQTSTYNKLIKRGMSPAQAAAFSKHTRRAPKKAAPKKTTTRKRGKR